MHASLYARRNTPTAQPGRGLAGEPCQLMRYDLRTPTRRQDRDSVRAWHETHETCVAPYLSSLQTAPAGANSISTRPPCHTAHNPAARHFTALHSIAAAAAARPFTKWHDSAMARNLALSAGLQADINARRIRKTSLHYAVVGK